MNDIKIAFRALRKSPGFSLVAVLTIAVGVGANTALFSVYDRLVLHPVTIPDQNTLVAIWVNNTTLNFNAPAIAWPRYEDIRDHARSFSSIGVSAGDNFTLTGNGEPEQLTGLRVSASFLPTLGIVPALGRNFASDEDVPNGAAVCVISDELWKTRFGGRADVVGSTITLNGQPWQVVGVMPPRMSPPFAQVQVYAPRVYEIGGLTPIQIQNGAGYLQPIARLKPGVSRAQAQAELAALDQSYQARFATRLDANSAIIARDYVDALSGNLQPTFYTLLAAVAFVLLIACANVASLFLGRLTARHREIAVRQAIGGSRARVVRQFLIESLVFSAAAAVLGTLLAIWALDAVAPLVSSQLPPNTRLTLNWRALAFTGGITVIAAFLIGVVPALQASRSPLMEVLKDSPRGSSSSRGGRFRSLLIVGEVALSVVLLVGSSLLVISFMKLQRTAPGFDPGGAAAAFVSIPQSRYSTLAQQVAFFDRVVERLEADPRISGAAVALALPLVGTPLAPYAVGGRPVPPLPQRPLANFNVVSDHYFKVMRIPFVSGRPFDSSDREGAPGAIIVNESLARRLFPGESPLGKVIRRGRDAEIIAQIVGVTRDVKSNGLNRPAPDELYYPMRQSGVRAGMNIVARIETPGGDSAALQPIIRSAVAAVDRTQAISLFATLDTNVANSLGVQRIVASLTTVFGVLALMLSAVGLYSVLAYLVSQRAAEIGIRMALGAQPQQVVSLVMRNGLQLVAIGLVLGWVAAAGAARLIQTLLFDVAPLDPAIYSAVTVLFSLVAGVACLVPSMRAARIDPIMALRADT